MTPSQKFSQNSSAEQFISSIKSEVTKPLPKASSSAKKTSPSPPTSPALETLEFEVGWSVKYDDKEVEVDTWRATLNGDKDLVFVTLLGRAEKAAQNVAANGGFECHTIKIYSEG